MKTLFLNPPSFDGFDGGAGSRYQARREVRSFWYPTWLAQAAALVPDSVLIDAPPEGLSREDVARRASEFELIVIHTSTPSLAHDAGTAAILKEANPRARIGFVGAHAMVLPGETLAAAPAVDFVTTGEFDEAVEELAAGRDLDEVAGIAFRGPDGGVRRTAARPPITDLDRFPFVTDVYARHLDVEKYDIGYLQHPYVSLYTGTRLPQPLHLLPVAPDHRRPRLPHAQRRERAAPRWPTRSSSSRRCASSSSTTTPSPTTGPRAEAIARGLGKLGLTWSCNAKANVPFETLQILKDNGLRLLLVGFESGNQEILNAIRKGTRVDRARRFAEDCRRLGILLHGTFILGLPGETRETIERTIAFAKEVDPYSLQVSLAAPYPGTELHRQATEQGWLTAPRTPEGLVESHGFQEAVLSFDDLSRRGDARGPRALLPGVLLPPAPDPAHRSRHAARPRGDAPPAARGTRVPVVHDAAPRGPERRLPCRVSWS